MKKEITEERIEEVIYNAFSKVNKDVALCFADNIKVFSDTLDGYKELEGFDMFFAAITTAQKMCLEAVKETLKELLCEQNERVSDWNDMEFFGV